MSQKRIFVIMPFASAFDRGKKELTYFFQDILKNHIENHPDLNDEYVLYRSDSSILINDSIIEDLHDADIVIADLSGRYPNPNVMYELGIRFAASNKPTLLIREENDENERVFDVAHLYAEPYDVRMYGPLQEHLIREIKKIEEGATRYRSPVFKALEKTTSVAEEIAREKIMAMFSTIDAVCEQQRATLAAYILDMLRKAGNTEAPGTTSADLFKYLDENKEQIMEIDWSDFRFQVQSNSAIEMYLEHPYGTDLFPESLGRKINGFYATYYVRHVSTNFTWAKFELDRIFGFYVETQNAELIADRAISYLKTTDKDKAVEVVSELHEILNNSHLV